MAVNLPNPPPASSPSDFASPAWQNWFARLATKVRTAAQILWTQIDFTGSSLTSIATRLFTDLQFTGSNLTSILTRNHNDLQNIQGGAATDYNHLTTSQVGIVNSVPTTYAPLASPALTGTPTAPTATTGTSTTQIATTAFVQANPIGTVTRTANTVLAGPTSGAAAIPTFRGIVYPDFATNTFVDVQGSTQTVTNTGFSPLIFPTVNSDVLSEYNNTTGTFTPQQTGIYLFYITTESATTGITNQRELVSVSPTASTDGIRVIAGYTSSSAQLNISGSRPIQLTGGTPYYINIFCPTNEVLSGSTSCAMTIKRVG